MATVSRTARQPFSTEQTANARLIAAAPDMLAALKELRLEAAIVGRAWSTFVIGAPSDGTAASAVYARARAAIAKATGSDA